MGSVLDGLRERLEAAKARQLAAHQQHQAATAELNAANAELNVWNAAFNIESREMEKRAAAAQEKQMDLPDIKIAPNAQTQPAPEAEDHGNQELGGDSEPVNKTELVRGALRERPHGMTAADLWKALQHKISSRAYLYSILKRLRDGDEAVLRKSGKYVLKPKPAENKADESSSEVILIQEEAASE